MKPSTGPPGSILISRTDSIGDVVLTLPMAGVLKDHFPGVRIGFLGKAYTRPVIEACRYVDEFVDVEDFLKEQASPGKIPDAIIHVFPVAEIAMKARAMKIGVRIGTTNRAFHWGTCNRLVRLSRKGSGLHEAQLNMKLLSPLGITGEFPLNEIGASFGMVPGASLPEAVSSLIHPDKYNLILHPKSQGSAREWGLPRFISLIGMLDKKRYRVFISGTAKERTLLQPLFDAAGDHVTDITGMMDLSRFITFISRCDGLVANSTGPLHIAAALGKTAVGIYPPMRPIHPGRWAPLGPNAHYLVVPRECNDCRKAPAACHCIMEITPQSVLEILQRDPVLAERRS